MALEKIVFDTGTIITHQFLNNLQDAVIAEQNKNKLLLYNEEGSGFVVPYSANTTTPNMPTSSVLPSVAPIVGDVVIGITTGNIGIVTAVSTSTMSVKGKGLRLLSQ